MTDKSKLVTLAAAGVVLALLSGCASRDVRVTPYGAYATLLPNQEILPRTFDAFRGVRFTPARTTLSGRLCPPLVVDAYTRKAQRPIEVPPEFAAAYPGGAPLLTVDSEIVYFNKRQALGPSQLIARVKMYADRRLVFDSVVFAISRSSREAVGDELAQEAVAAIRRFLVEQKQ